MGPGQSQHWKESASLCKSIEDQSALLRELRIHCLRHDGHLTKREKERKEEEASIEHQARSEFWTRIKRLDRKEAAVVAKSKALVESASTAVNGAAQAFATESGTLMHYYVT